MSDFNRGYMIAVSNLLTMYGREEIARGVLDQLGVSRSTMERLGFDEPDRSNLRRLFKESDRLAALAKRKATIPATGHAATEGEGA